jgi:hypothetical protein
VYARRVPPLWQLLFALKEKGLDRMIQAFQVAANTVYQPRCAILSAAGIPSPVSCILRPENKNIHLKPYICME